MLDVFEISGFRTGVDKSGVNFLEPKDAFEYINNGFIYRQEIKSRQGFCRFGKNRLAGNTRVLGIFEDVLPDGTKELLVVDKKYLYKYDNGTDTFIQIPFNARLLAIDPAYNFGVVNNEDYISGTSYFTKSGGRRFVFCGKGLSTIFFYDGSVIGEFTNTTDNPDYHDPISGALNKATNVIWFGERINFFKPVIGGIENNQAILYSGIRDSSGKGDKFNISGAGMLSADTYEDMKGSIINGDKIVLKFNRSDWLIEKTRDPFNPYFIKKIPSVIGTDATFSLVSYGGEVKSLGKTGAINTNMQQSKRFDDKIPYFTRDNISAENFELTYGGFDKNTSQFMFSYRDSASQLSDITQDKTLIYNYEEGTWSVNDQRFSVFGSTEDGQQLTWNDIYEANNPSWATWDTTEEIWDKIGINEYSVTTLAGDNDGFIYQLNADYDDYFVDITNITQAAQAVLNISTSAFKAGDRVVLKGVIGMTEINDIICDVISSTATSVTVNINSTEFTAYASGGTLSKLINFEAKLQPFNPYREKGYKCFISEILFLLDNTSGDLTVSIFPDEESTPFKRTILSPDSSSLKKREWISVMVDLEADFHSIKIERESYDTQSVISAIRIYCKAGGEL